MSDKAETLAPPLPRVPSRRHRRPDREVANPAYARNAIATPTSGTVCELRLKNKDGGMISHVAVDGGIQYDSNLRAARSKMLSAKNFWEDAGVTSLTIEEVYR